MVIDGGAPIRKIARQATTITATMTTAISRDSSFCALLPAITSAHYSILAGPGSSLW